MKRMPFITVLQNTENVRAGGEFKGTTNTRELTQLKKIGMQHL